MSDLGDALGLAQRLADQLEEARAQLKQLRNEIISLRQANQLNEEAIASLGKDVNSTIRLQPGSTLELRFDQSKKGCAPPDSAQLCDERGDVLGIGVNVKSLLAADRQQQGRRNRLEAAHCLHCGAILIISGDGRGAGVDGDSCTECGGEFYPVTRVLAPGRLKLGDDYVARVEGVKGKGLLDGPAGR